MFERYLSDVLTSYFGQYIQDDIDIETIRISAWRGGAIVLRDVQLRRDCLQHLLVTAPSRRGPSESTNGKHEDEDGDTEDEDEDDVRVPIELIYGHIGRLELHIPWKVLRNQFLLSSSSSSTASAQILLLPTIVTATTTTTTFRFSCAMSIC
jgi:hypothetical protein